MSYEILFRRTANIFFSALSARDSIAISMVAQSPSLAFMPCACYTIKHNLNLTETMTSEK
jgi:hypothetical protein